MTEPELTGNRCQCRACGEYFSRTRAFDRHRVGDYAKPSELHGTRRCLTVAEMTARGWQPNPAGFWIMDPMDRAGRDRVRGEPTRPATLLPTTGRVRRKRRKPAPSRAGPNGERP